MVAMEQHETASHPRLGPGRILLDPQEPQPHPRVSAPASVRGRLLDQILSSRLKMKGSPASLPTTSSAARRALSWGSLHHVLSGCPPWQIKCALSSAGRTPLVYIAAVPMYCRRVKVYNRVSLAAPPNLPCKSPELNLCSLSCSILGR